MRICLRSKDAQKQLARTSLRYWQTRTHCCGHIVADTNVSPFARARNICWGHKFCVRDTKNVSDFGQKHFVSATNVSQFAQHAIHHEQQCVRNNVSATMCPHLPVPLGISFDCMLLHITSAILFWFKFCLPKESPRPRATN